MKPHLLLCILLQCGALATASIAATTTPLTLTSANTQVSLVELYTSEGCSSCPPADRWLAALRNQPGLWRDVIPVAFHVDYWDYMGWRDRFAATAYSARQQRYVRSGNLSQVYTPGVLLQGSEWRAWTRLSNIPHTAPPSVGPLRLQLDSSGQTSLLWWPAKPVASRVTGTIVLLGFDLTTPVRRGENAGRDLHHDFVVLGSSSVEMLRDGDHYRALLALPRASNVAPRHALAAWVSAGSDPAPLQAVGGWFPER